MNTHFIAVDIENIGEKDSMFTILHTDYEWGEKMKTAKIKVDGYLWSIYEAKRVGQETYGIEYSPLHKEYFIVDKEMGIIGYGPFNYPSAEQALDNLVNHGAPIKESMRLVESKEDKDRFAKKFGQDALDAFLKRKDVIRNKYGVQYTDMTWCVKHVSNVDMFNMLDMTLTKEEAGERELAEICADPRADDVTLIYDKDGYQIYKINNVYASIKYGLAVGPKGKWCISGGWNNNKDGNYFKQANEYYYKYLRDNYHDFYFCFTPWGDKYCICAKKRIGGGGVCDIVKGSTDKNVSYIPGLTGDIVDPDDGSIIYDIKDAPVPSKGVPEEVKAVQDEIVAEVRTRQTIDDITNFDGTPDDGYEFDCQQRSRWDPDRAEDAHYRFIPYSVAVDEFNYYYDEDTLASILAESNEEPYYFSNNRKNSHWNAWLEEEMQDRVDCMDDDAVIEEARDVYDYNDYAHTSTEPEEIPEDATGDNFDYRQMESIKLWLIDRMAEQYTPEDYMTEIWGSIQDFMRGEDLSHWYDLDDVREDIFDDEGFTCLSSYDGCYYEVTIDGNDLVGWRDNE